MESTDVPAVEMQEIFCECGSCGKTVTIPVEKFLAIIQGSAFSIIVAKDCPTPPLPTDRVVDEGETYKVYQTG